MVTSTQKSDAARLIAVDTARRATQSQQADQAQQQPTTTGAEQADKTRDVLAAADVDNERARQVTADPARAATPALPAATPTGIATADQGPFRVPGSDVVVTPAQAAALDNESTRLVTAMAIADPIAKREAVEAAFATPELFAQAQQTFATLPAAERTSLLGSVPETTDLQTAVLAQKQGYERNTFVDAVRERAGIAGLADPVYDSTVTDRAIEIEQSLVAQTQRERLTDEQLARGMNSGLGAVRAVSGGVAVVVGGAAMLTPTGAGQVVGGVVAAHGVDQVQAGIRQAISGEPVQSVTEQGIAMGAEALGFDKQTAEMLGAFGDALAGFGASSMLRVATAPARLGSVADDLAPAAATTKQATTATTTTTTASTTTTKAADGLDPLLQQRLAAMEERVDDPFGMGRVEPDLRDAGMIAAKEARIRASYPGLTSAEYTRLRGHQAAFEQLDAIVVANADVLKELPKSLQEKLFIGAGSVRGQLPSVDDLGGALKESRGLAIVKEATDDDPAKIYDHGHELMQKALALFGTLDPKKPGRIALAYQHAASFPLTAQQQGVVGEYLEAARRVAVSGVEPGQHAAFSSVRATEIARINTERIAVGLPPLP